MYCPKCGTQLEDDVTTCPNCGAKISRRMRGRYSESDDGSTSDDAPQKENEEKQGTRLRRPLIVVLVVIVVIASFYALASMWRGEETEEEQEAPEKETQEDTEAETETTEDGEESAEEEAEAEGEDIVVDENAASEAYELSAFESSWTVIQQHGMDGSNKYYRDFVESVYNYSDLSFTLKSDTLLDMDDYYYIEAVFNKPVMVPVYLSPGDQYTIETDELRGTITVLTCVGSNSDYNYLEDDSGQQYYCSESGSDQMAELYQDSEDRVESPFYEGVLRIRKDAVTGDAITHGPYTRVTEADLAEGDGWFNVVGFDENGYVKQLIFDGD